MAVIAACAALVAAGVAIVVKWGGESPEPVRTGWLRYAGAALAAGALAGVLAAGAGGRLVMRLLALTSPDAEGSLTEAGEFVGEISAGGTLGLILFGGLPAGLLAGAVYALVRPLLPAGRPGGVLLGALLLVVAGSRIDPLRSDNIDFGLLGPGWLAVLAFAVLGLFHGMVVAAAGTRLAGVPAAFARRPRALVAGRAAVAVVALVALPGFVASLSEILD